MTKNTDRLIAYRTMRAVEGPLPEPVSRWQRWHTAVYRLADMLLGSRR